MYLAGVRALHISHGFHTPLIHTIKLQQTLRGNERVHSSPAKQKLPITFDLLCRLHYLIDPHSADDAVYWAAMTTAHFLLLRAGEFTVPSKTSSDAETLLRLQDVTLHTMQTGDEYVALHLRKSKTDQQHRGMRGTLSWSCSSHCLCSLRFKDQSPNSTSSSTFHPPRPIVPTFLWTSPSPQRPHHMIPFIIAPTCGSRPSTLQWTQFSHWWCSFCYHRWT